jgi:hypothetical protein
LGRLQTKDETGNKYGKLSVIDKDTLHPKYGWFWNCICDCGRTASVRGSYLRIGHTISCGFCSASKGETVVEKWLMSKNIYYEREKKFDDCINTLRLPFDFYIPYLNACIEFNGEQHYHKNGYFGGEAKLLRTKKTDAIKKKYCIEKGIDLIVIPYNEINNVDTILKNHFGI